MKRPEALLSRAVFGLILIVFKVTKGSWYIGYLERMVSLRADIGTLPLTCSSSRSLTVGFIKNCIKMSIIVIRCNKS
jgi:hypothetical protein